MDIIIYAVVLCAVTVAGYCCGRYILPKIEPDAIEKLDTLSEWAADFVVWARQFMQESSGTDKMAAVVEQLKKIAEEAGLKVTEDQLKAIAQTAYEAMKAGEAGNKSTEERTGGK